MRKLSFILIIFALCMPEMAIQAQKKKATPKPKVQPVVERKPKTAEIDSLINAYLFDEAADLIDDELDTNPAADYAAILTARQQQAAKGSSMLEATQRVVFVDSIVVGRELMLQTINIDGSCGQLLNAKQMKDLLGLKEQLAGTGFVNDFGDHAIFSQTTKGHGTKLMQASLFGDKWSAPAPLCGIGDSLSAEGFPFLMADGTTLYFAATDEASLGGYDIYITRYDAESGSYLKPENVGMPFNSPANEYLMVYDEVNNLGWLVSDRNQPADKVCVYVFIPDEARETYDDLPDDQLRSLAAIHSIKASQQKAGAEVNEALARLQTARTARHDIAKSKDLNFDVAYGKRYKSLDDFRNPKAKEKAAEWAAHKLRHEQLATLLADNRHKYAAAQTDAERKALGPVILRQEQELQAQAMQLAELANKVRALEIEKQ